MLSEAGLPPPAAAPPAAGAVEDAPDGAWGAPPPQAARSALIAGIPSPAATADFKKARRVIRPSGTAFGGWLDRFSCPICEVLSFIECDLAGSALSRFRRRSARRGRSRARPMPAYRAG